MHDDYKTVTPGGTSVTIIPSKLAFQAFVRRSTLILLLYALFVTGELTFHWYAATRKGPAAQSLRNWYLERDPQNGKQYHRGYVDWEVPANLLGLATGIVLARSWMWAAELVLWALLFSAGNLALSPYYLKFFPELTGSPNAVGYVFGVLSCGFAIAVGRVLTAYLLQLRSNSTPASHVPLA